MEYSKTFKVGDWVKHKYRPFDFPPMVITNIGEVWVTCLTIEHTEHTLFKNNIELDKNAIVSAILKDL